MYFEILNEPQEMMNFFEMDTELNQCYITPCQCRRCSVGITLAEQQQLQSVYTGCVQAQYLIVGHLCFGSAQSTKHNHYSKAEKWRKIDLKRKNT